MHTDDIVDSLNRLIETSTDGELDFRQCASHARDPDLARFLHDRADTCHQAAAELRRVVLELGGSAEDGGSAGGALHRGWLAMKKIFAVSPFSQESQDTSTTPPSLSRASIASGAKNFSLMFAGGSSATTGSPAATNSPGRR